MRAFQPCSAAEAAMYKGTVPLSGTGKRSTFHSVMVSGLPATLAAASQSTRVGPVNGLFSSSPVPPSSCTTIMSPTVRAGSELSGLVPQVLVVTIGTLTASEREFAIMSELKRCSRSLRNSFEGPGSQERQVLSLGSPCLAAKEAAAAMYHAACLGTFLFGKSQLPKWLVISFSLLISMAAIAGSSL